MYLYCSLLYLVLGLPVQGTPLHNRPQITLLLSFSSSQIQDQIIEDIMGLEEKFGDTLGGLPYLESGMMAPQTVSENLRNLPCVYAI